MKVLQDHYRPGHVHVQNIGVQLHRKLEDSLNADVVNNIGDFASNNEL